jgi:hypothetical protein
MLSGGTGSGKTYSVRTLLDAGLEVFCLFTEPGMETLSDTDPERLHWHYVPSAAPSFADLKKSAGLINKMTYKGLSQLEDISKGTYTEMLDFLDACCDFPDDRTGRNYGAVDSWDTSRVFVLDSLSGLSVMALNLVTGSKPVRSQGEWGVAMDNLERLIQKFTVDCQCHFVLTTHLDKLQDEITGGMTLMAATLGRKLAPKLPINMSDVIMAQRNGSTFTWSTTAHGADLKARNVPLGDKIPPSFALLHKFWKEKQV